MAENFAEQPIEFITKANTMNSSDDSTALAEDEVALLENFVKSSGVFEVREGKAALNTGNALAAGVYGLSTLYPLDSDTKHYVVVSNSKLYAGSSFPLTDQSLTLTTSTLMKMAPFQGRMLVNDPSKGICWYDGTSSGWTGIPSPKESKLIDDYETVTGWSVVNGTATIDDTLVIHGRHGVKFKATSGTTYSPRRTITSVNLNVFPSVPEGDAAVSTTKDYIRVQLSRSFKSDFTSLDLVLQSSSGNWSYARLSDFPEWQNNDGPGVVFDFYIRKGQFQAGAGTLDWTAITQTGFDIIAPTGKTPFIIVDYLRLERSGPNASEIGRLIASFESDETWTEDVATVSYEYKYKTNLSRSLVLSGSGAACHRTFASHLDLSTFTNGATSEVLDDIEIKIARDSTKTTGTLTISLTDGAVTSTYAINAATQILTPRIGSTAASKLKNHGLVFQVLNIRKSEFSNYGTLSWSTIDSVTLTASATAGKFYVDEIRLVKHKDSKVIYRFEKDETVPTVVGASVYGYSDKYADKYRGDEGSSTSFYVNINRSTECTIDVSFSPDLILSSYAATDEATRASQDSDLLGPWIWISESTNIKEISLLYDTHDGTFTNYFIKQLLRGNKQIPALTNKWFLARFEKREHEQIPATGATGTWANICKARLKIVTNDVKGGVTVLLDQWLMTRGEALTGRFWYAVTYKNARGARSELSNFSQPVEVHGGNVMLSDLPVSTGQLREIWRIGGLTNEWKLAGVLGDDESTYYEDCITEDDLGEVLPPLYTKPPISKAFCVFDNFVIRANLTSESGGYRYKSMVAVGVEGSIDEIDPLKTFDVGKDDGYEILALVPYQDRVYVFKEKGIYSFDPYNLDQTPIRHSGELGIISQLGYAIDPHGLMYFITPNKEMWSFNASTFDDTFSGNISNYLGLIPDAYVSKVVGEFFEGCALFSISTTGGTKNSLVLYYDVGDDTWSIFTGWPVSIFHINSKAGASSLICGTEETGATMGLLYTLFSGGTDDGTEIRGIIQTADRAIDPTLTGQPASYYITAKSLVAGGGAIRLIPYYDCVESGDIIDVTISSASVHTREEGGIPSPAFWPTYVGFRITTFTSRLAIRSLAYSRRNEARR